MNKPCLIIIDMQKGMANTPANSRNNPQAEEHIDQLLQAGDVLLMRPLTLHTSSKASGPSLRRVLHFVFGPLTLPYGLYWQQM